MPAILVAGFFVFHFVFAYDSKNAHRALTYEAAEFYNLNTPSGSPSKEGERIAAEEIDWLMQGAQEEDTPPRWINHFYNPITGEGWTAEKLGGVDSKVLALLSSFALSSRAPISSKNWAKNRSAQGDYWRYGGDQTWQRAIELYAAGDRKGGLIALGHTLHLLEDLTVPDHSRNDTHAGLLGDKGSSYEAYAQNQATGKIKDLKIAENLLGRGVKPLNLPILDDYFNVNAKYSHDNFFSDDTIQSLPYPVIESVTFFQIGNDKFIRGFAKNNNDRYSIVIAKVLADGSYSDFSISDPLIMSAYWERLSKQAVVSGAGAINLFFQEVEKYKKTNPTPTSPPPSSGRRGEGMVISPFGELVKLNNFFVQLFSGAQNVIANILPQAGKTATVNVDELSGSNSEIPASAGMTEEGVGMTEEENPPPSSSPMDPLPPFKGEVAKPKGDNPSPPPPSPPQRGGEEIQKLYVSHVIDGDTVTLNNGKDVRLIGMDTPEAGEKCATEATQAMKNLVLGKYVTIEKDTSEMDKYNRLLRFIYTDGIFINAEMIKNGYATIMTVPPDTKYSDDFKILENEAKSAHRGCLWAENKPVGGAGNADLAVDRGPYYGGSSWAGNPEQPGQNTVGVAKPYSNATSTPLRSESYAGQAQETATSTLSVIPASEPESSTSTPSNISTTSTPETATSTPQIKIIINEVQIAGATADDEFIELYNPNSAPTDITDWNLAKKIKSGTESNLVWKFSASTTIPANSYFLIVSQKATSTPADTTYSGSSFYIAADSTVLLKNKNGEIIDKVGIGEAADFETAPTLNPPKNQSISRVNFSDTDNNQIDFIISTSTPQGTSSTPAKVEPPPPPAPVICVTPTYDGHKNYEGKADTSKTLPFPQISASSAVTLSSGRTYYIASDTRVPATSRLIIPDGVVIKFGPWVQGAWSIFPPVLIIEGDLEINGTKNNPVVFTTFRDDAYGEKINMSTSTPAPADWGYVEIDSRKGKNIKITGAKFLYGGGAAPNGAALLINGDADTDISDSEFSQNKSGIFAKFMYFAGDISFSNNNFEYNGLLGVKITDVTSTPVSIIGNSFKCNGFGRGNTAVGTLDIATTDQYWSGAIMTISNNNFWGDYQLGVNYNKSYRLGSDKNNANLPALNNYWGDPSGPYHKTANPGGKGSAVSDYVNFSPWNTAPAL